MLATTIAQVEGPAKEERCAKHRIEDAREETDEADGDAEESHDAATTARKPLIRWPEAVEARLLPPLHRYTVERGCVHLSCITTNT